MKLHQLIVMSAIVAFAQVEGILAKPIFQRDLLSDTSTVAATQLPTTTDAVTAPSSPLGSAASTTSPSSSSAAALQTPGFVNNGTVGTFPCALPAELAASFGDNSGSSNATSSPADAGNANPTDNVNSTSTTLFTPIPMFTPPTFSVSKTCQNGTGGSFCSITPSSSSSSSAANVPQSTFLPPPQEQGQGQQQKQVVYSVDTGFSKSTECGEALPPVYPYNPIRLRAPDDSIRATFLPYAATLSELWVKDRWGQWRDVVLGFDNKTNYGTDPIHPDFAPVVGRYANRIKNGTFELDGKRYNTTLNENGVDTLHGGNPGYDRSSFTVSDWNSSSVTFKLHDPSGNQGFPNAVDSQVTYSLLDGAVWTIRMNATASGRTPIMLSSHVYWQLEAYNKTEGRTILDHVFHLPKANKYIETDSILIPTGSISDVTGTGYDFLEPKTFGSLFNLTKGYCGAGCQGWDTCFVMSEHERDEPVIELWSNKSGIKLSVRTDQDAFQVYTCDGLSSPTKGSLPRKVAHGGDGTLNEIYENHSCVVLEAQDYIDAVNHPEWGRDPIYSPERPYVWEAEYTFSTV
ncbi:hypothetical protein A4X13_0g3831 [Tilletia indica]|uniref:Aldose 1-epimerase n=1 Tax=Tilletia indica TaxID=43049 RepID=A0A177T782_9BASI|nr:hypothetical protein A4X13_0g3831 [Tilletia indica]